MIIKKFTKFSMAIVLAAFVVFGFAGTTMAAWTTPDLGVAASFGVLSSTFTVVTATTINGDVGYTVAGAPTTPPTVNGTIYPEDATFTQAGIDQGAALSSILNNLNSQACTVNFAPGAINLGADNAPQHTGTVYTPGVYCIDGAMTINTAPGITLSGA
jgi:hypothetical protein